ncbi:hypothetical protein ACQPW1_38930 [Nocardia sp. CA-128927]
MTNPARANRSNTLFCAIRSAVDDEFPPPARWPRDLPVPVDNPLI